MFELSYNDLKSTVQNHNYFYTKLITVEDLPGDAVYKNPPVNAGTQVLSLLPEDFFVKQGPNKASPLLSTCATYHHILVAPPNLG